MKITIEHYDQTITVELSDESTLDDVVNIMTKMLAVDGYSLKAIQEKVEE